MALRSRLRELFQDAQPGGVITVEEPPSPAGASWVPRSPPASPPRGQGPLPKDCAVFQCRSCWAVLGDSLHLWCAWPRPPGQGWAGDRVTNDVTWEDSLMIGLEGALLGCAYNALSCRLCGLTVGFILYSASKDLAYLRGLFCFFKDRILCYILKNQMIIEASKVNFPTVTLKKQLQEVRFLH
uniref:Opa interacting protein 5 n=1 Tax=Aquila chrysaetos chrysaetos TaxID=223781 RepID=A0A663EE57_AQUCH